MASEIQYERRIAEVQRVGEVSTGSFRAPHDLAAFMDMTVCRSEPWFVE
jgi:hypothetical protein